MLRNIRKRRASGARDHAPIFAALGDETRLALVTRLAKGEPCSISQLTQGSRLTRQAITKHLHVLEIAGMVRHVRAGRERRYAFNPEPVVGVQEYLTEIAGQWDKALARLKAFVESDAPG